MMYHLLVLTVLTLHTCLTWANTPRYSVDPSMVTVSGISAGGAMATQYHVAFSSDVKGVASFAGVAYYCSHGLLATALNCMYNPWLVNVNSMTSKTDEYAAAGKVDPTSNMAGSKVFIFHGSADGTVKPGNADLIEEYYAHYGADIVKETELEAEHTQPTWDYGNECTKSRSPYISDCDYDGALVAMNHTFGGSLVTPDYGNVDISGAEYGTFSQASYLKGDSLDELGFYFIPSGCLDGGSSTTPGNSGTTTPPSGTMTPPSGTTEPPSGTTDSSSSTTDPCRGDICKSDRAVCKLHIVFHGCKQGRSFLEDEFFMHAGYIEAAEVNNIILLNPQIQPTAMVNPYGCFDWWGYTDSSFATNEGKQMAAIHMMQEDIVSGNFPPQ